MATTGAWYYRLCSALSDPDLHGSLSGPVSQLPPVLRAGVVAKVAVLPDAIAIVSLRELAWPASAFGRRHGLNLLAAEALAAALSQRAVLATSIGLPPRLQSAAEAEGVRVIGPDRTDDGRTIEP